MTTIKETLETLIEAEHLTAITVALSGGIDSVVLLHALSELKQKKDFSLNAIHIHHGLSLYADDWLGFCNTLCDSLKLPLLSAKVHIDNKGKGIEHEARHQRYLAFESLLKQHAPHSALFTAHHQDDQAETVVLRILRGTGLKGLGAMLPKRHFASTWLYRPFLGISKKAIQAYAVKHALNWITDDSNENTKFERNWLRHKIMPLFRERHPSTQVQLAQLASHCQETQALLNELLLPHFHNAVDETGCLSITALQPYSAQLQNALIRQWLHSHSLPMPDQNWLDTLRKTVMNAREDAQPELKLDTKMIRRYQQKLYCTNPNTPSISRNAILEKAKAMGLSDSIPVNCIEIRYYQGTEKIHLPNTPHRQTLKNLFQAWKIPPWERHQVPLLTYQNEIVCILGYALADSGFSTTTVIDPAAEHSIPHPVLKK